MKKIITILFTLVAVSLSAQSLYNPATLSPSTRNISVTKGFQVIDTALLKGKVWIPTGATNGFVLTADANGFATWQAAGGVGTVNANNGLGLDGDTVKLGGDLVQATEFYFKGNYIQLSTDTPSYFNNTHFNYIKIDDGVGQDPLAITLRENDDAFDGNLSANRYEATFTNASGATSTYLQDGGNISLTSSDNISLTTGSYTKFNTLERGITVFDDTSVISNNDVTNNATMFANITFGGSSSVKGNTVDGLGLGITNLTPGIQFNRLGDNCHVDSNEVYGHSVIWDMVGDGENCYVNNNYIYNIDTGLYNYPMIDNIRLHGFDVVERDSIYGIKSAIKEITMNTYSSISDNVISDSNIVIGTGFMQKSRIDSCNLNVAGIGIRNFMLFNSDLKRMTGAYSLNNVVYINKGRVDLSTLSADINNTTWIGGTTNIDAMISYGKVVFYNTDSATIYALPSPVPGETYYCTDCTPVDNTAGGVKVCYNGTLWRREW